MKKEQIAFSAAAVLASAWMLAAAVSAQPAEPPKADQPPQASRPEPVETVRDACKDDIEKFCKEARPGIRGVMNCLAEHEAELADSCKPVYAGSREKMGKALTRQEKAQAACKDDIDKFCKDINPGQGRVAECLKGHQDELSESCRGMAGSVDAGVRTIMERQESVGKVRKACKDELEKFCSDLKPGGGGISACLGNHEADLSDACKTARAEAREKANQAKERMNRARACANDAEKFCKDVKGRSEINKCLDANIDQLSDACSAVRQKKPAAEGAREPAQPEPAKQEPAQGEQR